MNDHNYAKVLKLSQIRSVTRHMFSMSDHNYSKVDLDVDLLNEMNSQVELITVKALRNGVRRGVTYSHVVKQNQPSTKTKLSTTTSTKTSKSKAVYTTTNPGKNAHNHDNDKENSFQSTAISHCSQHIEMKSDTSLDSFNIQNVPGDGNCFFHCLSLNMFGDCKNSSNIRTNTCGFVLQNWYSMENKVNMQHSITNRAHYAQQMIYKNGYATACEIEAASVYYKRQINIWLRNGPNDQIMLTQFSPNNETSNKPIDLLLEREHFQLLRPTTDSPVLNLKRPTSLQSVKKIKKAKKVTIRPNDVIKFSKRPPTNMTESTKYENCCTQQSKISIESDTFIIPNVKSRKPKQKKGKNGQNSLKNKLVTKDKVFVDNKCDNVCSQSRGLARNGHIGSAKITTGSATYDRLWRSYVEAKGLHGGEYERGFPPLIGGVRGATPEKISNLYMLSGEFSGHFYEFNNKTLNIQIQYHGTFFFSFIQININQKR